MYSVAEPEILDSRGNIYIYKFVAESS